MLGGGLEILTDGQDVAAGIQNIVHQTADLILCLTQAHHEDVIEGQLDALCL